LIDLICQHCGSYLSNLPAPPGETVTLRCPSCDRQLEFHVLDLYATGKVPGTEAVADGSAGVRDDGQGGWSTLFHPGSLPTPRDDPETEEPPDGDLAVATAATVHRVEGTLLLQSRDLAPADEPLGIEAFFLIAGEETVPRRIPLKAPRTTFGRTHADVDLSDDAVSGRHFEVEILGRELFIRDLESRNGTFLNGRSIRHCELRPGDEVLAGRTVLIFQTSEPSRE